MSAPPVFVSPAEFAALFRHRADVFVCSNQPRRPGEVAPEVRLAPEVSVVFEIISPGTGYGEMVEKRSFYEAHGVEEYYVYYPAPNRLAVYVREVGLLHLRKVKGFVSPRLGIRFDLSRLEMP